MKFGVCLVSVLFCVSASAADSATPNGCTVMASLVHQASTDFPSLRQKRLDGGKCAYRKNEFRCEWAFPGDAFAYAEAQSQRLAQCMAEERDFKAIGIKKNEAGFVLEPDLSVLVGRPEVDTDGWKVRLRIVSAPESN